MGSGEVYANAARALARTIAGQGIRLVYGGGNIGLDHAVAERFLKPEHRAMVLVENGPEALIRRLQSYRLPEVSKWIGRGQT